MDMFVLFFFYIQTFLSLLFNRNAVFYQIVRWTLIKKR